MQVRREAIDSILKSNICSCSVCFVAAAIHAWGGKAYLAEGFVEGRGGVQLPRVSPLWGFQVLLFLFLCCCCCRGRGSQLSTRSLGRASRGWRAAGTALCSCPGIAFALFLAEQRPLICSLRGTSWSASHPWAPAHLIKRLIGLDLETKGTWRQCIRQACVICCIEEPPLIINVGRSRPLLAGRACHSLTTSYVEPDLKMSS